RDSTYGPSESETTRLPAAPAEPETTVEDPDSPGDRDASPSDRSTRAWSAVDGDGRRSGSRRREDKEPGWRAPWERDD
ncbi:hypothetical protein G6027_13925, partial [Dietzia sp. SLG310A2-38A2]|uniref:hypothetical protein n=1 Tax=Dietzia sp. SLG310A2-38A2 TaxID=1630643 RepID=UPI0015F8669F